MSRSRIRFWQLMASAKLAAWLIAAQLGFLLLSFVVPQRGIFPDEQVEAFLRDTPGILSALVRVLALEHVFTSPLFYATASLLALNLAVCTWRRMYRRRSTALPSGVGTIPERARTLTLVDTALAEAALASTGARVTHRDESDAWYYLRRGGVGFIGSLVLHAALIGVIAGGVITALTTFRGTMVFTEGQSHSDVPEEYLSIDELPVLGSAFGTFQLTLNDMEFTYGQGEVIDATADFLVVEGGRSDTQRARVNYPLHVSGKSFLLQDAGHAVALTVQDAAGTVVVDSFVNLLGASPLGYRDSLVLPDGRLYLVSRPDRSLAVEQPVARGLTLVEPLVGVSLGDSDTPDAYQWVAPGSSAVQVGQYLVTVHEVRIWNSFLVRADGGRYLIYLAFLLVILGSVVRFLDPDRWLRAVVRQSAEGTVLHMWGAERYRTAVLPKEGERIVHALLEAHGVADGADGTKEAER